MTIGIYTADLIGDRSEQQDSAGSARLKDAAGSHLLVLADGVGGQAGGGTASQIAVDTLLGAAAAGAFDERARQRQAMSEALEKANRRIGDKAKSSPTLSGMATTLVAAIVSDESLAWISVGDSHLYLFRRGRLRKLNEDHSLANMMVKSGRYSPGDPALDQYRDVIASAVSGRDIKHIDLPERPVRLEEGDIILLASDGLDTLSPTRLEALIGELANTTPRRIADILLSAVETEKRLLQDNTTLLVAGVQSSAHAAARPGKELSGSGPEPLLQTTAGSQWVLAALLLIAFLAGGAWWYLRALVEDSAPLQTLMTAPAPEKPARTGPPTETAVRKTRVKASSTPRVQPSSGTRRVVPNSLKSFDCQLRIQVGSETPLPLPEYCRRYFGDRAGIRYF